MNPETDECRKAPSDKLLCMMGAHVDGVYKLSARENCDELITEIINLYFTSRADLLDGIEREIEQVIGLGNTGLYISRKQVIDIIRKHRGK